MMANIKDNELDNVRKKIDSIDKNILALVEERFELVNEVARIKKSKGLPIRDLKREEEVIKSKLGLTELSEEFVAKLYRLILDESIKHEEDYSNGKT
jgi:monofunctional chorismate mutase